MTRPCGTTSPFSRRRGTTAPATAGRSPAGRRSTLAACITRRTSTTTKARPSTSSAWTS
nr:MAG TPA_asm: hypothetical protein [Caudoviricetes sp.]